MCSVLTASSQNNFVMGWNNILFKGVSFRVARLSFVLAMIAAIVSCDKVTVDDDPNEGKEMVTFDVMNVDNLLPLGDTSTNPSGASTRAANTSTRALEDNCNRISLAIFSYEDGSKVMQVDQTYLDEDFGLFTVWLARGKYYVVLLAYTSKEPATIDSPSAVSFYNNSVKDTFYKYAGINVGATNRSYSFTLQRATSLIRLEITGDIPDTASRLTLKVSSPSLVFNPKDGVGATSQNVTVGWTISQAKKIYDIYVFAMENPQILEALTYTATGTDNTVIRQLNYENVIHIAPNNMTLIKGDFFKTRAKSSIEIDDTWEWTNEYDIPE